MILAPTLHFRGVFDLPETMPDLLDRVHPVLERGIGFAEVEKERRRRSDLEEIGLFLEVGFGADCSLAGDLALGTRLRFNVLPTDPAGEMFFFSWELILLKVDF